MAVTVESSSVLRGSGCVSKVAVDDQPMASSSGPDELAGWQVVHALLGYDQVRPERDDPQQVSPANAAVVEEVLEEPALRADAPTLALRAVIGKGTNAEVRLLLDDVEIVLGPGNWREPRIRGSVLGSPQP